MRLPFMQLESDLVAHGASTVAALTGCSVPAALGHIALLRAWAVSRATDEAPPDGLVPGDAAARLVEAAAQWTGEKGALLQALLDAGQVAREETGLRVLHLNPYVTAWERNAKAKARMANARERSANKPITDGERPAKFGGQTQTQTQNLPASQGPTEVVPSADDLPDATEDAHPVAAPEADPRQVAMFATPPPAKPEKRERTPSAAQVLYGRMEAWREERCAEMKQPFRSEAWAVPRINKELGPLVDGPESERDLFADAFMLYLADERKGTARVPWSISLFMQRQVRAEYETAALRTRQGAA